MDMHTLSSVKIKELLNTKKDTLSKDKIELYMTILEYRERHSMLINEKQGTKKKPAIKPTDISISSTNKEFCEVTTKWNNLKRTSEAKRSYFNLSLKDVAELLKKTHCEYTGVKFDNSEVNSANSLTIDRFDNNLGYVKGNVFAVTNTANFIKSYCFESTKRLTNKELKKFVKAMESLGYDELPSKRDRV